jgi:hypothetical protein
MPELSGRPRRSRIARRYAIGVGALAAAAGLVLTAAASSSAAPATQASPRVITLTSSTSSQAGQLTVTLRYEVTRNGGVKPLSVSYSGGSSVRIRHCAILFALAPVAGPTVRRGRQVRVHAPRFVLILKVSDSRHFSGTIPARTLPKLIGRFVSPKRRIVAPPTAVLEASLASATTKPKQISLPVGLQVGVLLGFSGI